jgi:predicted RNase H-like HicB family nuclease
MSYKKPSAQGSRGHEPDHEITIIPPKVPYAGVVREDEATDGSRIFLAEVPELPGCMAHGETPEEAKQNLEEAIDLYLQTLDDAGMERPRPQHPPLTSGTGVGGAVLIESRYDVDVDLVVELHTPRR